jgi:hypothetical protein
LNAGIFLEVRSQILHRERLGVTAPDNPDLTAGAVYEIKRDREMLAPTSYQYAISAGAGASPDPEIAVGSPSWLFIWSGVSPRAEGKKSSPEDRRVTRQKVVKIISQQTDLVIITIIIANRQLAWLTLEFLEFSTKGADFGNGQGLSQQKLRSLLVPFGVRSSQQTKWPTLARILSKGSLTDFRPLSMINHKPN